MYRLSRGIGLWVALWTACGLFASDWTEAGRPAIKSYGQRDGLPHQTIYGLQRDHLGRIWACTGGGPASYDGRRWTALPMPREVSGTPVRTMLEDSSDGSLWFGVQSGGVWRFHNQNWQCLGQEQGFPGRQVNHLLAGPGGIWAATNGGPVRWDGAWRPVLEGLPSNPWLRWSWRLGLVDVPGVGRALVVCTKGGPYVLAGGKWVVPAVFEPLRGQEVNDILQAPDGLWISAWQRGPAHWDGARWVFTRPGDGFPAGGQSTTLATTTDGEGRIRIWVGTYEHGLACLRAGRWEVFSTARALLSHDAVYTLLPDPQGRPTIWLGTKGGGVTALNQQGWRSFPGREIGVPGAGVFAILESHVPPFQGFMFGTRKGLGWKGKDGWHAHDRRHGLPSDEVIEVAQAKVDGQEVLFAGTTKGMARWNGSAWRFDSGLPDGEVRTMLVSRETGQLNVAMKTGVYALTPSGWKAIGPKTERLDSLSLAESHEPGGGSLWVGTVGQGVWRLHGGVWRRTYPAPDRPGVWYKAVHVDSDAIGERIWTGGLDCELRYARIEEGDPAWCLLKGTKAQEMNLSSVYAIEHDRKGRVYLGTDSDVKRLMVDETGRLVSLETFTTGDGLPATGIRWKGSYLDRAGRVWFGFPDGAAFLDPSRETPPAPIPTPVMIRATVNGEDRALSSGVVLGHRENNLSLEYFLPQFFREENIRFRSQLVGAERVPGPWRHDGVWTFPGLRPGRYELRVWAQDHSGRTTEPATIAFRIRHPWYWGPWAWAVYALALAGSAIGAHLLRVAGHRRRERELSARVEAATKTLKARELQLVTLNGQLERRSEEKSVILGMVAHDLRSPLTAIRLQAEVMRELGTPASAATIYRGAQDALDLVERLLSMNRLEDENSLPTFVSLDLYLLMEEAFERLEKPAAKKGIILHLEPFPGLPEALGERLMALEIMDNLLSNAIKFSPSGRRIDVGFLVEPLWVGFRISDQGPGFSEEDQARAFERFAKLSARPTAGEGSIGLGLAIVKKLVSQMDGQIELKSRRGEGATFTIRLPRARNSEAGPGSAPLEVQPG